jgi:hypothetical protein
MRPTLIRIPMFVYGKPVQDLCTGFLLTKRVRYMWGAVILMRDRTSGALTDG